MKTHKFTQIVLVSLTWIFHAPFSYGQPVTAGDDKVIMLDKTWQLTENTIIGADQALLIMPGGAFDLNGQRLVLEGDVQILTSSHIFRGPGEVYFHTNSVQQLNPLWWGATANDQTEDHRAFQAAIDCAISSKGVSRIFVPAGEYMLGEPLMMIKDSKDGSKYGFFNLTLEAGQMSYGANANVGGTTVFNCTGVAGIMIQSCRGVTIENIVIKGPMQTRFDISKHLGWSDEELLEGYPHEHGQYNPSAAIVIDPFAANVEGQRYSAYKQYYKGDNGSSWIRISGCVIEDYPVGIVISPHGNFLNAENITIEKSRINAALSCIAICQSQSRQIQVQNCTLGESKIIFDSYTYGGGRGSLPEVLGLNASTNAGWLFKANSGYAAGHFTQVYAENIFGLGYGRQNKNTFSFYQCNFKFPPASETGGIVNASVLECGSATFEGCTIRRGGDKEGFEPVNMHVRSLVIQNSRINTNIFNNGEYQQLKDDNVIGFKLKKEITDNPIALTSPGVPGRNKFNISGKAAEGSLVVTDQAVSLISGEKLRTVYGFVDKVNPDGTVQLKAVQKGSPDED